MAGNVICSDELKYTFHWNTDKTIITPKVFLVSKRLLKIGQLYPVNELRIHTRFNEVNECSFTIYKNNDGYIMPLFDRVKDLSIVYIEGFGYFSISLSTNETDAVCKRITGKSLQENELSQCFCTMEVNTEEDPVSDEYNEQFATQFYRTDGHTEASLLHRLITDAAPHYSIGHVDQSLHGLVRQFSWSNQTVEDAFHEIEEEIGCIFVFDKEHRTVNVYDMEDHCENPECQSTRYVVNGVCQNCKSSDYIKPGYGLDTSTYVDTTNLAKEIENSVEVDQIKNCFKLVAGDDTTTNLIGQRLIGGTSTIWTFSEEEIEEMSDELKGAWLSYQNLVKDNQSNFNNYWDNYNNNLKQKLYWESGRMPEVDNFVDVTNAQETCKNIYNDIVSNITETYISSKNTTESIITNNILKYAKLHCNAGYDVEFLTDQNGKKKHSVVKNSQEIVTSWTGYIHVFLKNCKDDSGDDKYYYNTPNDTPWHVQVKDAFVDLTIDKGKTVFTNSYFHYIKEQVNAKMKKIDGIVTKVKYDYDYNGAIDQTDPAYYLNYFTGRCSNCGSHNLGYKKCLDCGSTSIREGFGRNRLQSFLDAYSSISVILNELNNALNGPFYHYIKDDGNHSEGDDDKMYNYFLNKYSAFITVITNEINRVNAYIENHETECNRYSLMIQEINKTCNLRNYFNSYARDTLGNESIGEEIFHELYSFKREQVYENRNFTSDVLDDETLMDNIEEFLTAAKQEIAKACQFQHTLTVTMANLLSIIDYQDVFDIFAIGNYIRIRTNGQLAKVRIVGIEFNFDSLEESAITFSDTVFENQSKYNMQQSLAKAASLATSFDFTQRQSQQNDENTRTLFHTLYEDGLDVTKTSIMNSVDQEVIMDAHGLLGRQKLPDGTYSLHQCRLNGLGLIFTDDNWDTIKTALGYTYFNGKWMYGLIADRLVGKIMVGEKAIFGNGGSVVIDGGGVLIQTAPNIVATKSNEKYPFGIFNNEDIIFAVDELGNLTIATNAAIQWDNGATAKSRIVMSGNHIQYGNVIVDNSCLGEFHEGNLQQYNNSLNFRCENTYGAEVALKWDANGLYLLPKTNGTLHLGNSTHKLGNVWMSGNVTANGNITGNTLTVEKIIPTEKVSTSSAGTYPEKILTIDGHMTINGYVTIDKSLMVGSAIKAKGAISSDGDLHATGNCYLADEEQKTVYLCNRSMSISQYDINEDYVPQSVSIRFMNTGLRFFQQLNGFITPMTNGDIRLGSEDYRWKDIYLAGQINGVSYIYKGKNDDCITLEDSTTIADSLEVKGVTTIRNTLSVRGATITDSLEVMGATTIKGTLSVGGTTITGSLDVRGITITDSLDVIGTTSIQGTLSVRDTTITDSLEVLGTTSIQDTLSVRGTTITDSLTVKDGIHTKYLNSFSIDTPHPNNGFIYMDYNPNIGIQFHEFENSVGIIAPMNENATCLGCSDLHWSDIYASDSSITVSDRNQKDNISYIGDSSEYQDTQMSDEQLIALINGLKSCVYKRKTGNSNRPHHGVISQDFEKLLLNLGIDHAAFIKSPCYETKELTETQDGEIIVKTVQEIIPEQYHYGMRYEELIPDIIRFIQILYQNYLSLEKQVNHPL